MPTSLNRRAIPAGAAATAMPTVALAAVPTHNHGAIFAAIEAHRAAWARLIAALDAQCALERELPAELRQSHISTCEREIVDTDDPRWIASEEETNIAWEAVDAAAWRILDHEPATLGAVMMLLTYVVAHVQDEPAWPEEWLSEMVKQLSGALARIDAKMGAGSGAARGVARPPRGGQTGGRSGDRAAFLLESVRPIIIVNCLVEESQWQMKLLP
jgi:hypothetical protein